MAKVTAKSKKKQLNFQRTSSNFQENMLLSFYNWPMIESSAINTSSVKNTDRFGNERTRSFISKLKEGGPADSCNDHSADQKQE